MSAPSGGNFKRQYDSHLKHLRLKGLQPKTIEAYARAIRRIGAYFGHEIEAQNYPNPFNPSTTIVFDIPEEAKVSLKIYDALGSEVATIVDEKLEPGYYKYEWNAKRFASGVYFYRLTAGTFTSTKKLMLLK